MTDTEKKLLESLRDLEKAAAAMATANPKPDLKGILSRLAQLSSELPTSADAQLRHYMQRQSYQKARVLLEEMAAR